uniref:Uncharacterized protein n=1 Tax=Octopus bimaculoides TaxID=37653 RepID=A0A0L8G9P4_OCTBM
MAESRTIQQQLCPFIIKHLSDDTSLWFTDHFLGLHLLLIYIFFLPTSLPVVRQSLIKDT